MATSVVTEKKVDGDCGCDGGRLECNCGSDCQCPNCSGCDGCDKGKKSGSKSSGGCCGSKKNGQNSDVSKCPALARCPAFAEGCPFADGHCPFARGGAYQMAHGSFGGFHGFKKGGKVGGGCPMRPGAASGGCPMKAGCCPMRGMPGGPGGPPGPHGHKRGGDGMIVKGVVAFGLGAAIGYLYGKLSELEKNIKR